MFETATTEGGYDAPYEMTHEQYIGALAGEYEPQRTGYAENGLAEAEAFANRQSVADGINELERHANGLAGRETRENDRNVEDARTIGHVATLICTYRDDERAA